LVTLGCVLWPGAVAAFRVGSGPTGGAGGGGGSLAGAGLLLSTFFYSGLIAVLAVAIGWPAAWVLRRAGPARIALLGAPLLGPSYLAYAGWGILRGQGTWLGGVIARADPGWHTPTIAWHANAVIGLVLWAWPLAAFTLAISLRRIPDDALEMLRLEARTRRQALWQQVAMARTGLAWAFGLVLLVMLGSAVPLHVAQVRTWAIHVWTVLATSEDRWRVWAAAWPLLAVALAGAWLIGRRIDRFHLDGSDAESPRIGASRAHVFGTVLLWLLSVVVPAMLFLWSVKAVKHPDSGAILQTRFERFAHVARGFLRESADAIANSTVNALFVGAIGALVGAGVWAGAAALRPDLRRAARWCTRILLVAAFMPGILVGLAVHQAWDQPAFTRPIGDSPAIFVIAHLARFSFIGALVGWLLARAEPPAQRDLRTIDGAIGLAGWARICLAQSWPVLAGAALAMAALSLHEIEAAIWVQRPGEPFLARQMLDDLHYARDDRLAVGVITMMVGGLALGLAAAWLVGIGVRSRSSRAGDA
jgi:ABC-type Fe3+ transport system permease subunit